MPMKSAAHGASEPLGNRSSTTDEAQPFVGRRTEKLRDWIGPWFSMHACRYLTERFRT